MRLGHNLSSLNAYTSYSKALQQQSVALERISSGYKINSAKDNPNGIAQSERMRMQIRGLQMASRNSQDGMSMLQTAEGGLDGMTSMLQRMRELVVKSGSAANSPSDKEKIQKEIDEMVGGMDDIANNTEFNGVKLLGQDKILEMPVGANAGESISIEQKKLTSENLKTLDGKNLSQLKSGELYSVVGENNVDNALDIIDQSINTIVSIRSKYGAIENRFEENFHDVNEISDRMDMADSSLRDADIAEEMINYTKSSIVSQAGSAIMVQTNKFPQEILRILENVKGR